MLENISLVLFVISTSVVLYAFWGYEKLLLLLSKLIRRPGSNSETDTRIPTVSVLLAVHNEAPIVVSRLNNILASDYPGAKLDIVVASDGSDDPTERLVKDYRDSRVSLYRTGNRLGKTEAQNRAIGIAKGEIVVFTDADTVFEKQFLQRLVRAFKDSSVGCATGRLEFGTQGGGISQNQGRYWSYELRLRELESRLGILAVASGPVMAIRKSLFRPMDQHYGEDCVLPLDIVGQRRLVKHVDDAVAYDKMPASTAGELQARTRMTLRNWQGTFSRRDLLNPLLNPRYSFSLLSHKILRWLTPFFVLTATASAAVLSLHDRIYWVLLGPVLLCYITGWMGFVAHRRGFALPIADTVYSFALANLGFLLGVVRALFTKSVVTRYNNES